MWGALLARTPLQLHARAIACAGSHAGSLVLHTKLPVFASQLHPFPKSSPSPRRLLRRLLRVCVHPGPGRPHRHSRQPRPRLCAARGARAAAHRRRARQAGGGGGKHEGLPDAELPRARLNGAPSCPSLPPSLPSCQARARASSFTHGFPLWRRWRAGPLRAGSTWLCKR